jgi:hypothetical protein
VIIVHPGFTVDHLDARKHPCSRSWNFRGKDFGTV